MPTSWNTVIFKFRWIFATDERRIVSGHTFHMESCGSPLIRVSLLPRNNEFPQKNIWKLCPNTILCSCEISKWLYSWTSVIRPSVIRISLLYGHDLAVYCLLSILSISNYRLYSLAQDKNKVVQYCICFILLSNPLNMSDNLLQIE